MCPNDQQGWLDRLAHLREFILDEDWAMRLALKYEGPLLSSTDKQAQVKNKNLIRWRLSDQIFRFAQNAKLNKLPQHPKPKSTRGTVPKFKQQRFVALIDCEMAVAVSLKIRIDRREMPGSIVHDGDLDNRLKTLLDALRLPHNNNEVQIPDSEKLAHPWCWCLLEDDTMVTALNIETASSLRDLPRNHVEIVIDAEIKPHDFIFDDELG